MNELNLGHGWLASAACLASLRARFFSSTSSFLLRTRGFFSFSPFLTFFVGSCLVKGMFFVIGFPLLHLVTLFASVCKEINTFLWKEII